MTREVRLTGERLHADCELFGVDLARHRAAYAFTIERALELGPRGRVLDLGSGSGYGTAQLARSLPAVYGLDRVAPDARWRESGAHHLRADLRGIPLAPNSFELIVSFQVIEHLEDPAVYLEAIARLLTPTGTALITTPNLTMSDGVNPFHVHEYRAAELEECLRQYFGRVEMWGVSAGSKVAGYFEERLRRIRLIMKLDPLRIRHHLPAGLVEWIFGRLALVVRRGIARGHGIPDASTDDFPIGPADVSDLDLLAICREPVKAADNNNR